MRYRLKKYAANSVTINRLLRSDFNFFSKLKASFQ